MYALEVTFRGDRGKGPEQRTILPQRIADKALAERAATGLRDHGANVRVVTVPDADRIRTLTDGIGRGTR